MLLPVTGCQGTEIEPKVRDRCDAIPEAIWILTPDQSALRTNPLSVASGLAVDIV